MIKFVVNKVLNKNKENNYSKVEATIIDDIDDMNNGAKVTIISTYFEPIDGEVYTANDVKYGKNSSLSIIEVKDTVPVGMRKTILNKLEKELNNLKIEKRIIDKYISIDSFYFIKRYMPKELCDNKELAIDKILYYKNMNNLLNLRDEYNLSNEIVGYFLSKDYTNNIEVDLCNCPYKIVRFANNFKIIEKLCKGSKEKLLLSEILEIIYKQEDIGHTFSYTKDIEINLVDKLAASNKNFNELLSKLEEEDLIFIYEDKVYSKDTYDLEQSLIKNILTRLDLKCKSLSCEDNKKIDEYLNNTNLSIEQRGIVKTAINNNVTIIKGGAGTGKTTIISNIINCIKLLNCKSNIEVVAFSGKAVNVLNQKLDITAKTIHRFLKIKKGEHYIQRVLEDIDYLIIDEATMVDLQIFSYLLQAVGEGTKIILVGDTNQIIPIGLGQPFSDLIESEAVYTKTLSKVYRQADESTINKNAKLILNNEVNLLKFDKEFKIIECEDNKITNKVIGQIRYLMKEGNSINDIMVLAPIKNRASGTNNLNNKISDNVCNTLKIYKSLSVGNKVIQIKNNYDRDVFNGETGIIIQVEKDCQSTSVIVDYEYKTIEYKENDLIELDQAFALTIHKSQGSKYNNVILVINESLNRNLIYVAITRAVKTITIIGSKEIFKNCCNKEVIKRNSFVINGLSQAKLNSIEV